MTRCRSDGETPLAYIAPSNAEQKVHAGYLAHCSAQAAYDWLRDRAPKSSAESREIRNLFSSLPDLEEYVLLRRQEPLIDLGLARYARTSRAVRRAYVRGGAACRIAAWSNVSARGSSLLTAIWANERDLIRLATEGSTDELITLAANPALDEEVLSALILRNEYFSSLTDKQWTTCIIGLAKNPRMNEEYGDGRTMDGLAEYSHNKVFSLAWGLANTLPAEQRWAWVLHDLLSSCRIPSGLEKSASNFLKRWSIDKERSPDDKYYSPGPSFYLRTRLADLLKSDEALLSSPDAAVRLSFWQRFDPSKHTGWVDDMMMVFQKTESEFDVHEVVTAALRNPLLWQFEETRETLKSLCWSAPDHRHDMMMPNAYQGHLRRNQSRHPEWFIDAAVHPDDEQANNNWTKDLAEPAWVSLLSAKVDALSARISARPNNNLVAVDVKALPPELKSWWRQVPWWFWIVVAFLGLVAARSMTLHQ